MNVLTITGIDFTSYLADEYSVKENKTWSKNTGRNAKGTFFGEIAYKKDTIQLNILPMAELKVAILLNELSKSNLAVTYWCPRTKATRTISAYSSDPEVKYSILNDNTKFCKPFDVTLIEK